MNRSTSRSRAARGAGRSAGRCLAALLVGVSAAACADPYDPADFDPDRFAEALPDGFLFGPSSSAWQIEGSTDNDWDEWARGSFPDGSPHVRGGEEIGLACDSWNRWPRDVEMVGELGANVYRMGIEWSRLEPTEGAWDQAAADRYREMFAALRAEGITPVVTVYHFAMPRWMSERGGLQSEDFPAALGAFAGRAGAAFGDLVDLWLTVNEPNVVSFYGWIAGTWPPGIEGRTDLATEAYARVIEAHAHAARALRAEDTVDADGDGAATSIGLSHHVRVFQPASSSPLDQAIASVTDSYWNDGLTEAIRTGRIHLEVPGSITLDREVEGLKDSLDWLGLNYYTRDHVRADLGVPALSVQYIPDGHPVNELGWEVYPEGLEKMALRFGRYGWPLYVTENGIPDADDDERADFLRMHLLAVQRAVEGGADVRGYFHWTLMDNFELAEGYHGRFGLYAVDFDDPERTRTARPSTAVFEEVSRGLGLSPR